MQKNCTTTNNAQLQKNVQPHKFILQYLIWHFYASTLLSHSTLQPRLPAMVMDLPPVDPPTIAQVIIMNLPPVDPLPVA
jgi:hypothetical protein